MPTSPLKSYILMKSAKVVISKQNPLKVQSPLINRQWILFQFFSVSFRERVERVIIYQSLHFFSNGKLQILHQLYLPYILSNDLPYSHISLPLELIISFPNFHSLIMLPVIITIDLQATPNMKQPDNLTQTRNSTEPPPPPSLWSRLKATLCPCLIPSISIVPVEKPSGIATASIHSRSECTDSHARYQLKQTLDGNENVSVRRRTKRMNSMEFQENQKKEELLNRKTKVYGRDFRETVNIELGHNYHRSSTEEQDCPIFGLREGILLSAGPKNRQLLVKISRVNITIKLALLKRQIASRRVEGRKEQKKYGNFQFNKYWDQRYILFEKFDQGIKLDENSWTLNPPQQVSQYLANKCNGAKIILDAFAGVGGNTIKLANVNSCGKVIANEQDKQRMSFLLNNAKVYEVDSNVELSEQNFFRLDRQGIDVVVLHPPLAEFNSAGRKEKGILMTDFSPNLQLAIRKAFSLANNLILLLPADTSIDSLCSSINKQATQLQRMKDFCSIKIQKIYCQKSIKYILVCVGTLVNSDIKLNDELEYLYSCFKRQGVYFKHKKVMKKIREDYGMLELFNLVKESQRIKRESSSPDPKKEPAAIQIFYELIRRKDLIPADKLNKIISEQDAEYQRQSSYFHSITFDENEGKLSPMMEEEKIEENPFNTREIQLTQSEYSHYSYFSSYDKKSGSRSHRSSVLHRDRAEKSNPSIIINRVNDSKEKHQSNSPLTPSSRKDKPPEATKCSSKANSTSNNQG